MEGIWTTKERKKCFPGSSAGKESACNAGDPGSIPGSESSLGEERGYPLQYSCLENPRDRGHILWDTVHEVTKCQTKQEHCGELGEGHIGHLCHLCVVTVLI